MTTEQNIEDSKLGEVEESQKSNVPVAMTAQLMELKINVELAKRKLTVADLETRALKVVKNEDNLKEMSALLKDLDAIDDVAEETHKLLKTPIIESGKAADAGKKLVFENTERIRQMVKPDYDRLLADVDTRQRNAIQKERQEKAIKKGIEDTAATFTKRIIEAKTKKDLLDVERLINLEKSPSKTRKYGEFHPQMIKRFNEVLLPLVSSQKKNFTKRSALNGELEEAVSDMETVEVDKLKGSIDILAEEITQNQAVAEDILSQEFFPVEEVEEVLPEFRTKRTDISFELADATIALKKVPNLLKVTLDNKAIRAVAKKMKEDGLFEGKEELIVDGIKYIVTRQREAL